MITRHEFYFRKDATYLSTDNPKQKEIVDWLNEQIHILLAANVGDGLYTIAATIALGVLRKMSTRTLLMRATRAFKLEKAGE